MVFYLLICCIAVVPIRSMDQALSLKRKSPKEQLLEASPKKSKVEVSQALPLPPELYFHILSFLSHKMDDKRNVKDWATFGLVCKEFHAVAQQWLPEDLRVSGEYALFKQVIKLREIAKEVAEKSRLNKEIAYIDLGEKFDPKPNPHWSPTKQGLFLVMTSSYPASLGTPWGKLVLYSNGVEEKIDGFKVFSARFLQRLDFTFRGISFKQPGDIGYVRGVTYYAVSRAEFLDPNYRMYSPEGIIATPSIDLFESYRGQSLMIYSDLGCGSRLDIRAIDGEALETPVYYTNFNQYRSYALSNKIWRTLQNMFEQQQQQVVIKLCAEIEHEAFGSNAT